MVVPNWEFSRASSSLVSWALASISCGHPLCPSGGFVEPSKVTGKPCCRLSCEWSRPSGCTASSLSSLSGGCACNVVLHLSFPSRSAHLVSRYRPRAPIIAVTRNDQTARQAHLYRGIFPVLCKEPAHDAWAEDVDLRVNLGMSVGE